MTAPPPKTTLAALPALLMVGLLLAPGCSKGSSQADKANQVDCKELCDRTYTTCVNEVLLASGKMDAKKLAMFKKLGILQSKVVKPGHEKCSKGCAKQKGRFGDGKAVNACLALKSCKEYAACIKKHL